ARILSPSPRRRAATPSASPHAPRSADHGNPPSPPSRDGRTDPGRAARRAEPVQRAQAARYHDRSPPARPRVRRPALRLFPGRDAAGREPPRAEAAGAHLFQRFTRIRGCGAARHGRRAAVRRGIQAAERAPEASPRGRHAMSLFALDIIVRASALLAAAALADFVLCRRASAATRHLVWTLAIGALLALPIASYVLPEWTVPVPIARPFAPRVAPTGTAPSNAVVTPAGASRAVVPC